MLVVLFASGMAVFGRETFRDAAEAAQEVQDGGGVDAGEE